MKWTNVTFYSLRIETLSCQQTRRINKRSVQSDQFYNHGINIVTSYREEGF